MACESQQQKLDGLKAERADVEQQLHQPNLSPAERSQLLQELKSLGPAISAAQTALKECQDQIHPPPPPTLAPATILGITPLFPDSVGNMAAKRDSFLNSIKGKKFPQDVGMEWAQPLAPNDDYDDLVVSCTGWMVHPRDVGGDFPFSHPFGFDWEFSLALDKPANAAGPFDYLLTPGNKVDSSKFPASEQSEQIEDETRARALKIDFPLGLLGIEMDGGLVPLQFKQNVAEGHRAAVFGRWIVDTGHDMHRGEIHPPLLMAAASVTAPDTTRAIFTSRPYLVSQLYTTDQGSVYKDSGSNDGTFYHHLLNEIIKINAFLSTLIECHPKVTEKPMRGVHLLHTQVRPPTAGSTVTGVTAPKHLVVSFHFTVRTGVGLQVISSAPDTIDVLIVLNSAGYRPPPLPHNAGKRYSQSELAASNKEVGNDYLKVEALSAAIHLLLPGTIIGSAVVAGFLARGVQGDVYDPQNSKVNLLATSAAVLNAPATNIPANAGIMVDDTQPYPVTGWVEAKWVSSAVVAEPVLTTATTTTKPA